MSLFVALEGIDACGKNTQSKLLADAIGAELFSFPDYETPYGKLIAEHLEKKWHVAPRPTSIADVTDALVFQGIHFVNRLELQVPLGLCLVEGRDVVCDRYTASALAYGAADMLDWDYLLKVQRSLIQPDLYVLIDIDVEDSIERRPERRDRYESNRTFITHVANNYRVIWDHMNCQTTTYRGGTLWVTVDGRGSTEEVHKKILSVVDGARVSKAVVALGTDRMVRCQRCDELLMVAKRVDNWERNTRAARKGYAKDLKIWGALRKAIRDYQRGEKDDGTADSSREREQGGPEG